MRLLLTLAFALADCTSTVSNLAPSPTASAFVAPVARSAAESTACARSLLTSFIDAFNRGDSAQLETFFSTTEGAMTFKWFVMPETPAYGPGMSQLPQYFATWHAGASAGAS
jgi:hypothetical protein